ncbi:hypothetical protein C1645_819403 [Glomus cerebriforme]|uniref:F-box domain-containing protein n=1 Tax=Glomus cerebriforme TaxID=658196 RepID=A0A397T5I6_9GLOM|nr:hypothetical protein C1645_819403 [Glomus cerebriforme]
MATNSLPEDCFYEIFKNIKDMETLYNCLFVNRLICRIIIPFLYQKPFSKINHFKQYYCLINTYLFCIDEEEKDYLHKNSIKITKKTISLFDYAKYLEIIPDLTYAVECWFIYHLGDLNEDQNYNYENDIQLDNNKLSLQEILLHLFLRKVKKCKELNIQSNLFNNFLFNSKFFKKIIINYSDLISLHLLCNNFNDLNNLKEELFHNFISIITNNCFNIKKLKITTIDYYYNYNFQELIKILIKNQKYFKILYLSYPNQILLNNLLKIIKSKKHTITHICIKNIIINNNMINDNIFGSIAICENLEKLEFINCDSLNININDNRILNRFSLKELIIHHNANSNFLDNPLICKFGHSLYNLSLHKVSPYIMQQISRYCLNLRILKIVCNYLVFSSYTYLKSMKIEEFTIYLEKSLLFYDNYIYILRMLSLNLPESLNSFTIEEKVPKYTKLLDNDYIAPKYLENFLNNCKVNLITLNFNIYIRYEILEKVLDYIEKRKSLKYLGIRSPPGSFWFKGNKNIGKQILTKIENNNVKIITIRKDE